MQSPQNETSPGLIRRFAAIFYDTLLVTALWMMLGGLLVFVNGNEVINLPIMPLLLPLLIFAFYANFWTTSGQTLGMQTWKIKLVSLDDGPIKLKHCLIRYLGAALSWLCLGLGYWWVLFDEDNCAWHDRWSGTRLVKVDQEST